MRILLGNRTLKTLYYANDQVILAKDNVDYLPPAKENRVCVGDGRKKDIQLNNTTPSLRNRNNKLGKMQLNCING